MRVRNVMGILCLQTEDYDLLTFQKDGWPLRLEKGVVSHQDGVSRIRVWEARTMLRQTVKPFKVLVLVLSLLSAFVNGATAEPVWTHDAIAVRGTTSGQSRPATSMAARQAPQGNPCNVKRRALIGAIAGSAIAMVVVQQAAKSNDGTAGAKGTIQAAGLGALVGTLVALRTCP